MSTVRPHTSSRAAPLRRGRLALRVLAVCGALGALGALWIGERARADQDLQLIVQDRVRPGETIAVRALLFSHIDAITGPRLASEPVALDLLDAQQISRAHAQLRPSKTGSMQGRLAIPRLPVGTYWLEASSQREGHPAARCRKPLQITPDGGQLEPLGRAAGSLQLFSLGPVRSVGPGPVPDAFDVRIPGGVCVPELPCELLVRVGEPAAALELVPNGAVELDGPPVPATSTRGLVRARVVVHGPEAQLNLRALREGKPVAERRVRLPVGLGEVALWLDTPLVEAGKPAQLRAAAPPGREQLVVDAYQAGDWRHTTTLAAADPRDWRALPFQDLPEGLWRLQARADVFSADGAGLRALYVRAPGIDDVSLLRELDEIGSHWGGTPPVFEQDAPLPAWALADVPLAAAYLLAPLEAERMPLPDAVSGRPAQLRRLSRTRNTLRYGVGALLVLAAFVVSGSFVHREFGAQRKAREALRDAGDATADAPDNRRRQALWLWGMAAGVAIAFLLAALLIIAKPLWF